MALLQAGGHLLGHGIEKGVDLRCIADVGGEGLLGREALALGAGAYRPLVDPPRALPEHPAPLPEAGEQSVEGQGAQLGDGRDAELGEGPLRRRTDAVQPAHRQRCEEGLDLVRPDHRQAVGLAVVGGDLGHQLVGGDADRDRQPPLFAHPTADVLGDRGCAREGPQVLAEVEEGLVERERLDERGVGAVDGEDRPRLLPVAVEVGLQEHRLRAAAAGKGRRHRRVDAEVPSFVAGRGHHPASGGVAADHHRFADERGIVPHVHRGVEAVHVGVQDAAQNRGLGHDGDFTPRLPLFKFVAPFFAAKSGATNSS